MKFELKIVRDLKEAYAVIYTSEITEEIKRIISLGEAFDNVLTVKSEDKLVVLNKQEVYMIRIEEGRTMIHTKDKSFESANRLCEVYAKLGSDFMQISKICCVNLKYIDSVEPYFNGTMSLKLKNGCKDYISRNYLKEFKRYLGI